MLSNKKPQVNRDDLDLFAIPEYVYKAMLAKGLTLAKLDEAISKEEIELKISFNNFGSLEYILKDSITGKLLFNNLSKLDVEDIFKCTEEIHRLFNYDPSLVKGCVSRNWKVPSEMVNFEMKDKRSLVDNLSDLTITMSNNVKDVLDNVFKVEVVNNHVYIIIRKGFFNFKLLNIPDFQVLVLKSLLFSLFKFFSPEQVQQSTLFEGMVSLFYNKNSK